MSNTDNDPVEIPYDRIVARTDMAICFEIDGDSVWLPNSQIIDHDDGECVVMITERTAIDKGLEGYV